MNIKMIAFDADDTLWHSEVHYQEALEELKKILSPWGDPKSIEQTLDGIEMKNLSLLGYGAKAFTLSMLEAALQISKENIQGQDVARILALGRSMLENQVDLFPHIEETLEKLAESFPLMVITKGDLLDQTAKVSRSGLETYFPLVEVVNDKTPGSYKVVFEKYNIDPSALVMVGNSIRSDIIPILALGGHAVHIPADTTWAHEMVPDFDQNQERFYEIEHIGQLPALIERIQQS